MSQEPMQPQSPHQQAPQPMQLQIPPMHQAPMHRQSPQQRPMMPQPMQPTMPTNFGAPQPSMPAVPNQQPQPPINYGQGQPRAFMPQPNFPPAGSSMPASQPEPDNRAELGKTRWDSFVANTIKTLAPAEGDLSPPPRPSHDDFAHPGAPRQSHPSNLAHLRSASVGDVPSIMNEGASVDQSSLWRNQDDRRFSHGNRPPQPDFQNGHGNKNVSSGSKPHSQASNGPPIPGHRRSTSDITGLLASEERPPRAPKGKEASGGGERSKGNERWTWRPRLAARLLGAFGKPKQAHMGEKNQFVYDKEKGRWVIPGEDVEDEDSSIPPPPDDDELSNSGFSNPPNSLQQTPDSSSGQLRQDVPMPDQSWPNLDPSMYNGPQQTMSAHTSSGALPPMGAAPSPQQQQQGFPPMGYRSGPPSNSGTESMQNDFADNRSESSAASIASAPAPSNSYGSVPPPVPAANKYRAGKVRGRRAYVDTFNPSSQSTGTIAPPTMPMMPRPPSQTSMPGGGVNIFRPSAAPVPKPAPAQAASSTQEQNWQNHPGPQQNANSFAGGQPGNAGFVGRAASENFAGVGMNTGAFDNNTRPVSERYGTQPNPGGYGGPGSAQNYGRMEMNYGGINDRPESYGGYGEPAASYGGFGGQGGSESSGVGGVGHNFGGAMNDTTSFEDSTSIASVNATSGPEGGYGTGSFVETSSGNADSHSTGTQASQYRQNGNGAPPGVSRMSA